MYGLLGTVLLSLPIGAQAQDALESLVQVQDYETRRVSSSHANLHKNGDARSIEPVETLDLGELEGPGMITHIWNTLAAYDPFYGRSLVLRMYWDGAEKPSVQVPLGDFFGLGHGAMADYTSQPVAVTSHGRARNCFLENAVFQKRAYHRNQQVPHTQSRFLLLLYRLA